MWFVIPCTLTTSDSSVGMAAKNTQLIEQVRIIYEKNLIDVFPNVRKFSITCVILG